MVVVATKATARQTTGSVRSVSLTTRATGRHVKHKVRLSNRDGLSGESVTLSQHLGTVANTRRADKV